MPIITFHLLHSSMASYSTFRKPLHFLHKNTHCLTFLTHFLLFCFPFFVSTQSWDGIVVTQSDFQALESFKLGLIDPNGFLKTWNDSGYGACSGGWEGIKCAQGQVIVIQLPWRGLGGQLTSKIGQLQALRKLSLHDNAIGGSIPKELGLLPNLRGIQLYNNRFAGSIPPTLGLCTLLQDLDFSNNSLVGGIPDSLWNCTVLNSINLSFNSFTGSIHNEIGKVVMLRSLDLSYNSINGSIPNSFSSLKSLSLLNLAHNHLNGQIPAFLGGQQNLAFLNVSYNNLSGHVPDHLSSKFDPSSFIGNHDLCGYGPSAECAASPPLSRHRRKTNKESLLIVAGALIAAFLLLCCVVLCCLLKKKDTMKQKDSEQGRVGPTAETPAEEVAGAAAEGGGKLVHFEGGIEFTADDLLCATAEIIGKSTYGTVYRATLVAGNQVAVKRLRERIAKNQKEFKNEATSLGKIRHPNLLAMRAYYLGPKGEKLLVFDYMPKGSLASFLHARGPNAPINWPTRMEIMKGMTRGLLNLHTQQSIIHGNLTSNNVLLDDDLNPKIGDYGLSRLMTAGANLNVIATAGALGYRAPELSKLKKANTKTDIYSLGVIMLELLTGKSPGEVDDGADLPRWVASIVKEEWTNEVFDLELMKDASVIGDELLNTLKLALHCVDPSPSARPEAQLILQQLEEIRPETITTSGD